MNSRYGFTAPYNCMQVY